MSRIAVVAVMGLLATGCVSISHVQTADTLGKGRFQFAMEPGLAGAAVFAGDNSGVVPYPHVDLAMRYGVTDRVDLGVRFGSSLVELQSKFLLTSPENPDKAISVAPSVMTVFLGSDEEDADNSRYTNLALPVLIGFKTDGGSELVVGPRAILTRVSSQTDGVSSSANLISIGGSVGYALRVANGFRVMPEVGVSYPVVGSVNDGSDSKAIAGFTGGMVQFKLGLLFGAGRPIRKSEEAPPAPASPAPEE